MNKNNIISLLEEYKSQYKKPVDYLGAPFDTKATIFKASRYLNSMFVGSSKFSNGLDKIFYNITVPAVMNTAKNIDLDTKDVFYKAIDPKYRLNAYFLNTKLRQWNSDNNMGMFLNNVNIYHVSFGSCIVKDDTPCPKIVDLNRFMFDTSVPNVDNTFDLQGSYAIEELFLTMTELEEMSTKGWENIDKIKTKYDNVNEKEVIHPYIRVLEAHIYSSKANFDEGEGYSYYKTYIVDDSELGLQEVLYHEQEEKLPYKKLDFNKRTISLGEGQAEILFEEQKNVNTVINYYNQSLAIGALNIFQTQDQTLMKNILRDARSGDVFNTQLSKIDTSVINEGAFRNMKEMLEDVGRRKTNSFEFLTGENLPANQTLGGQVLQTQQGAKWFDIKRENFGAFIDEIYNDWVLKRFEKDLKKEEVLSILDIEELQDIWTEYTDGRINKKIVENLLENDTIPTPEDIQMIRDTEMAKMEKKNLWTVTKEYLTGFERKLYIDTSGEKHNLGQKISVMSQVLLNSNIIDLLNNPMTKKAAQQLLEYVGFDANLLKSSQGEMNTMSNKGSQDAVKQLSQQFTEQGQVAQ